MSKISIKTDEPGFYRPDESDRAERAASWIAQARGKTLREIYEERRKQAPATAGSDPAPHGLATQDRAETEA